MKIKTLLLLSLFFVLSMPTLNTQAQTAYNFGVFNDIMLEDTLSIYDTVRFQFKIRNWAWNDCYNTPFSDYNNVLSFTGWVGSFSEGSYYQAANLVTNSYQTTPVFAALQSLSSIVEIQIPLGGTQLSGYENALLFFSNSDTSIHFYPCSDTIWQIQFFVENPNCRAAFTILPTATNGEYIGYNQSTGNGISYHWDFGDGDTSNLPYPNHTYATAGTYNVCLTVDNGSGCVMKQCDDTYIVFKADGGLMNQLNIYAPTSVNDIETQTRCSVTAIGNVLKVGVENNSLPVEMNLYSMGGQLMNNIKFAGNTYNHNIFNYSSGIYIAEIKLHDKVERIKWVKM